MRMRRSFATLLLLAGCATPPSDPVPPHETWTLPSAHLGEVRRLHVWRPPQATDSSQRLPVLYMLDGGLHEDFPNVANTLAELVATGAIAPLLLVGIENTVRRRDLTPPTAVVADRAVAPVVGGAPTFRAFLADELLPEVERRYRCTGERALVGESLAGLFVIDTLFAQPELFSRCLALSPSLWWNDRALVRTATTRLPQLGDAPRRLWFTAADETDIVAACDLLASALQSSAPAALVWTYVPHPEQQHHTIFRAAEAEAYRAALWPVR
jgi:predicted alpha/beta superfamily hydrolase